MSQLSFDDLFSAPIGEQKRAVSLSPVTCSTDVISVKTVTVKSRKQVIHLDDHRRAFVKLFRETARYHHRYEVFRDFVTVAAISLENAVLKSDELEQEYFQVIARYQKDDVIRMSQLLAHITLGLDERMCDFLGSIFMELEIGSKDIGQFFTPFHLSELMARLVMGDRLKELAAGASYITLDEPACGAGGMVIGAAAAMLDAGYNPQRQLLVQCTDLDPVAARMCYVQLSLLGMQACVRIGNTITQNITREMFTPFWYLNRGHLRSF
ncbi:N-6 DNA methylase [Serratia proteamaculans]|uniref:N-6 DNA methylase n=1 Tax=Serratia proteamaculans TaxID=28151 RepID=UPI0039BDBCD7